MGRQLNDWVINAAHWLQIIAIVMVGIILLTALDREPPFKLLPHDPVKIKAGTHVSVDLPVWRDLSRTCDARYDRYLFHSGGARTDLTVGAFASDAMIRSLPKDRLQFSFDAPPPRSAENPGGMLEMPGSIVTPLRYYCTKGHLFFPIEVTTTIPVLIEH